jgi:hypothetical protein
MLAAVSTLRPLWQELQAAGTYTGLAGALTHAQMNRLLNR